MTMPAPEEELSLIKLRAQARHAAMRHLIDNHRVEYDALHAHERTKRGLPAQPEATTADNLRRQNESLRALLREHGILADDTWEADA